ncbi:SGNH/GDSL hydrolase family protein [Streptomyces sp. NPDC088354]|uniref:SGNH/GDSL hydrolase family protein n=1 Tax=Streptomyces sp. NPDC088354 TaxID=3365856 RepID=UPI00381D0074
MRLPRCVSAASALVLTAALALTGAGPAQASGPVYVALGDSYASGVGSGRYDDSSGGCYRSSRAYPRLWAKAHTPSGFSFPACSGATTVDVINRQLGALNDTTTLVSVTVGGNDAGFVDVMTTCLLSTSSACLNRIDRARDYIANRLPDRLDTVYEAIGARAPAARVVVVGYPRFYRIGTSCIGLTTAKRRAINDAADLLDTVTAKRAADHGFAFADVRGAFTGHELCAGTAWLHSLTIPVHESYHPTASGQSGGYLPVFSAAA